MNVIETEALTKYYGRTLGINELNLKVGEGEFFGFIGPNGAGKSTTIRTLLGLISPTSGRAELFGLDAVKHKTALARDIGYMPSEAMFYGDMRVGETIKYSARLRSLDCGAEAARLCERLSLDTSKRIGELSLGNRKKVAVVCAMQHKPRLYILDEPTSGLDPLMQKEFFTLLHERSAEGATVFLSSHILSEIEHNCSRAAIIKNGSLIACDSVEKLSKTNAHRITLRGCTAPPAGIEVKSLSASAEGISFLYSGAIGDLIRALNSAQENGADYEDISITEPDLEEIFMHYYEKESK